MAHYPAFDDIPAALRERDQWIVWRNEARDAGGKPTKVPYQARFPQRKASSTAPHTWSDVNLALRTAEKYGFDGIGYVFSADDPFVGVDFDDILDADGNVADWAATWLERIDSYAEISPSGRGVKAFVVGKLPGEGVNAGDIELYDQGRYFAVTGRRIDGAPAEPRDVNGAVEALYSFAQAKKAQQAHLVEYKRRETYAEGALRNACDRIRLAPEGVRNDTLNRESFAIAGFVGSGLLDEQAAAEALADAAQLAGLGANEIRGTLRSGMRAGVQSPRDAPPPRQKGRNVPPATNVNRDTGEIESAPDTQWWKRGITLAELQQVAFPPLKWIIQEILPEGVCLIAAKPKSKKSWIALGIGIAVAMNGKALGRMSVDAGRVLFLDLEGNQRRVQSRVRAILGSQAQKWPDNLHVFTEWAKGDECIDRLEQWFLAMPDTKLVVIDLFAEVRPPRDPRGNDYDYDREMLVKLNKLAEKYGVAIIVIHHTRKAKGDDVFDEVSGTLGINGAVATLWILSRSQEGHVILSMTGRDLVQDEPLALTWDGYACSFVVDGTAADVATTAERKAIIELLSDDKQWTPRQIAADLSKSVGSVQQLLRDMVADGTVDKVGYGKYARIPAKQLPKPEAGDTF